MLRSLLYDVYYFIVRAIQDIGKDGWRWRHDDFLREWIEENRCFVHEEERDGGSVRKRVPWRHKEGYEESCVFRKSDWIFFDCVENECV